MKNVSPIRKKDRTNPTSNEIRKFAIIMIREDLKNIHFVSMIERRGMDGAEYLLGLTLKIFKLLGISDQEDLYETYFEMAIEVENMDVVKNEIIIWKMAIKIYDRLISEKGRLLMQIRDPRKTANLG